MNNFIKAISAGASATLKKRAQSMSDMAELEQMALVNEYKKRKAQLKLELEALTDLAPDSTTSLSPKSKDWDPKAWVRKVQQVKLELKDIDDALATAQETYTEFFTEIAE